MTAKTTAVVVRLPLSADQEETLFEISERDCLNSAIAAIGTPVAGGELEAVGFEVVHVHGSDLTYCRDRAQKIASGAEGIIYPLIRQSDAQAALAAAQAEIVRLREHLTSCTANLENVMTKMGDWCGENGPPEYLGPEEVMSAMDAYETGKEALKGPVA